MKIAGSYLILTRTAGPAVRVLSSTALANWRDAVAIACTRSNPDRAYADAIADTFGRDCAEVLARANDRIALLDLTETYTGPDAAAVRAYAAALLLGAPLPGSPSDAVTAPPHKRRADGGKLARLVPRPNEPVAPPAAAPTA